MKYPFRNLVFEGGGVKGVAYVGAMDVLERSGIVANIDRVAGTSAGALMAVMVGLGYGSDEIGNIMMGIDFKKFMDGHFCLIRLFRKFGLYKGDYFRKLVAEIIKDKTGDGEVTFADIERMRTEGCLFKEIYLVGTDLSTGCSVVFNYENTPDMKIADAARISMSIPLMFGAVIDNDNVYVDGGLLANYPVKVFDIDKFVFDKNNARKTDYYDRINQSLLLIRTRKSQETAYVFNEETLGFRLDGKDDIEFYLRNGFDRKPRKIRNIVSYIKGLLVSLVDAQDNTHLHSDDWQRTVYIDTLDVGSTDFGIDKEKKLDLVESGRLCTEAYLEWFEDDRKKKGDR